ncbi:MAG: protein kinase [Pyrinomonadaceae bacterium]
MKYCTVCNAKYEDGISFCAIDGEVLEDDPTTIVDSTLDGQYHIESMLGKGGMGAVYRARHILLGDRVAIKVLPPQMRNNAEWLRRFRREGQAARRFRHPNAVTVYDLRTTSEGMIYMVMEYVEGRTLDAELRARGRFTPAEALEVLEPVMSVLNAAHAQGVVHRDLKPENIMIGKPVSGQSVIKLLDLGIAKISEVAGSNAGGSTALTVAGQILGTPYYMSPEQWGEVPNDRNPEIDGRADIYSLGVVFYELVAGRRPFVGTTLQELRREHVSIMPRPLNEVMGDVPEAFGSAIARAMAKDRGERLGTAGELASELRGALGLPEMSLSQLGASGSNLQESRSTPPAAVGEEAAPQTVEVPEGRQTSSEVITPTIVTMDSPQRPDANTPPPAATSLAQAPPYNAQPPAQGGPPPASINAPYGGTAPPMATVATNPGAFQTDFQTPSYSPAPPPAQKKSSALIPIIVGVLGLLVLVAAGGGYFVYRSLSSGTSTTPDKPAEVNKNGGQPIDKPAATFAETLRYALEVETTQGGATVRVAGVVPLASGQAFKFHFTPDEDGYLYIVGPGPGNVPMTFLTAKPVPQSGVTTNSVSDGSDYSFPSGAGNWITLDKTPGTEDYTVIFSKDALTSPAFLNATAGRTLTGAEQDELKAFEDKYKANAAKTDVVDGSGKDPFVSVKVPKAKEASEPVIFKIRIEHK